jgi:hypothetical protein
MNPLIGKWVFEEDEDEFSGRYVNSFTNDGVIYLIEYEDKQDDFYKRKDNIGTFKMIGKDSINIYWQKKATPQEYKIIRTEKGINLINADGSVLHLIKTRQCTIEEKLIKIKN